jgi:hypothetical protein
MRILMAGAIVLAAALLTSGCTTLQRYPAFGTMYGGGRLVLFDREATAASVRHARNADWIASPPRGHSPVTVR